MALLAVWALLLTAPISAAAPMQTSAAACSQAAPGVVVTLGSASLEEYAAGDPANRIQLTRSN